MTLQPRQVPLLLGTVFLLAGCALVYELLLSTVSTYLLGSSVLHFSVTIGVFLASMGLGAYLSRFVPSPLLPRFIAFEVGLGWLGALTPLALMSAYVYNVPYYPMAMVLTVLIGTLAGIEIPLLTRMLQGTGQLKDVLARVFALDYMGGLAASLVFPLVLLAYLGTLRTGFAVGMINLLVAGVNLIAFRHQLTRGSSLGLTLGVVLGLGLCYLGLRTAPVLGTRLEQQLYQDPIIHASQSQYQRLILTRWQGELRLYLNGNLQFASSDEARYHEPLVHLPMWLAAAPRHVLLLGAGDGLAVRELLKHPGVDSITLVDLDPAVTALARNHPDLLALNDSSLHDPRVRIVHQDAYTFVAEGASRFDVIIVDLPDPHDPGLSKLYAREFYHRLAQRLAVGGAIITQATSPFFAPQAFWCIYNTVQTAFPTAWPVQAYVPSFGPWGFVLAAASEPRKLAAQPAPSANRTPAATPDSLKNPVPAQELLLERLAARAAQSGVQLRYLQPATLPSLLAPSHDFTWQDTDINTLDSHPLVQYYQDSWQRW